MQSERLTPAWLRVEGEAGQLRLEVAVNCSTPGPMISPGKLTRLDPLGCPSVDGYIAYSLYITAMKFHFLDCYNSYLFTRQAVPGSIPGENMFPTWSNG